MARTNQTVTLMRMRNIAEPCRRSGLDSSCRRCGAGAERAAKRGAGRRVISAGMEFMRGPGRDEDASHRGNVPEIRVGLKWFHALHFAGCQATLQGKRDTMAMTIEELESAISRLDVQDRARLARKLLVSLEDLSVEENLELWVEESKRRLEELRVDPGIAVDADEAIAEARASLQRP